jgi:hypothetical protein
MTSETVAVIPEPEPAPLLEVVPDLPAASVAEIAAVVTSALVAAWGAIRAREPEVPEAVITMATGGRESAVKLAHFSKRRWRMREGDDIHHEVFVTAEALKDGAEAVVATLVHEAAHGLNVARGVEDCSASQYHNKDFKKAAEHLGLVQKADVSPYFKKKYGFAGTDLSEEAKAAYADQIAALDEAIRATRVPSYLIPRARGGGSGGGAPEGDDGATTGDDMDDQGPPPPPVKEDRNYAKAVCACDPPTVIRVGVRALSRGKIMCADCKAVFTQDDSA